jgi:hypothetical protein
MRKIEVNKELILRIKEVLDEVEASERNGFDKFKDYWKSLSILDKINAILIEPNYYDNNINNNDEPIQDFYLLKNISFTDKEIVFDINKHANIFLDRLGYTTNEIIKIERREKLKNLSFLS